MVFGKRFISFLEFKSDKKRMKEALKWSEAGLKLVRPEMDAWEKMMQLKVLAQYSIGGALRMDPTGNGRVAAPITSLETL